MDQPPLGQSLGAYRLDRCLGSGGVATVYLATHTVLGSTHAVKVLHVGAPSVRRRLLLEGRIQASLRHPHVVPVTDTVTWEGLPGLVLEHVDGPDLEQVVADASLTIEQIDRLAGGLMAGLAAVHAAGFVHRDLKPANVLCQRCADGLVPRLADFGLARPRDRDDPGRTRDGVTMGTPAYMSPEQVVDARDADHRTDLWALGCILYELATGRPPFVADCAFDTMSAVRHLRPAHPRDLRPEIPQRMVDAILGCLVKDRGRRIQTMGDLVKLWSGTQVAGVAAASCQAETWSASQLQQLTRRPRSQPRHRQRPGHLEALVSGSITRRPTHLHALVSRQAA